MYCHNCGKEVTIEGRYCPFCGAEIRPFASQDIGYVPIDQTQPSHSYDYQRPYYREDDGPHMGFAILSFLFPIVGIILFIIWNKEYPQKAKSCLKGFISGIVTGFVLACCLFATVGKISMDEYNNIRDNGDYYDEEFDIDDFFSNNVIQIGDYE